MSFIAALSDIRSKRHIVLPNNKFYRELEKFDKQIVVDREENNCKTYGSPSKAFKLMKVVYQNGAGGGGFDKNAMQCIVADDSKESENEMEATSTPKKMRMTRSNSVTSPRENRGSKKEKSDPWRNGVVVDEEKKKKKSKKSKKAKKSKKKNEEQELNIEAPVDVTDVFPVGSEKKKSKKKKKKKNKK